MTFDFPLINGNDLKSNGDGPRLLDTSLMLMIRGKLVIAKAHRNGTRVKESTGPPFEAVLYYTHAGKPVVIKTIALNEIEVSLALNEWIRTQLEDEPYMTQHGLKMAREVSITFRRRFYAT